MSSEQIFLPTFMNSEHPGSHVFQQTGNMFVHIPGIIKTNILTKLHEDWTIHVTLKTTGTIFKFAQDIVGTNLLAKFRDYRTINVASRLLRRKNATPHIILTNLLTKFHEDRNINVATRVLTSHIRKNASPPCCHVFKATGIFFKLLQYIIGMNLLTKFHEDRTINVASRVLTRFYNGSNVFQANVTISKLIQDIIETNLLTKFHEEWTINVACRVIIRQMLTPHEAQRTTHNARRTKGDHKSSPSAHCAQVS
ncbi:hypothetical protein DPMN_015794 [Dreissena polymorpha]|uniref:Uncharacterized protein n=1 Tax=Dreissena polymorpha TaxID=45954 RepID=A0A9D4S3Y8_DREPO|nr:hypothetical protein DPMN_015794 [Dreissena polymorpha]